MNDKALIVRDMVQDFPIGMRVLYFPDHAHGDITHHDVEVGKVRATNRNYVFVEFDYQQTAKACSLKNLRPA